MSRRVASRLLGPLAAACGALLIVCAPDVVADGAARPMPVRVKAARASAFASPSGSTRLGAVEQGQVYVSLRRSGQRVQVLWTPAREGAWLPAEAVEDAPAAPLYLVTAARGLYVRSSPGKDGRPLDVLPHRWLIASTATGGRGWRQIAFEGRDAWVSGHPGYLAPLGNEQRAASPAAREQPAAESASRTELPAGEAGATAAGAGAPRFVAANAGNYTATDGRTIDLIVIHTSEGSEASCISWFQNPKSRVSAHYLVSHAGRVTQMVRDQDIAWHARGANGTSLGIENEGYAQQDGWTEAQLGALARLVATLCDRYAIPKDRDHVKGHAEIPGNGGKVDPGPHFPWESFMALVRGQ